MSLIIIRFTFQNNAGKKAVKHKCKFTVLLCFIVRTDQLKTRVQVLHTEHLCALQQAKIHQFLRWNSLRQIKQRNRLVVNKYRIRSIFLSEEKLKILPPDEEQHFNFDDEIKFWKSTFYRYFLFQKVGTCTVLMFI